MDGLELNRNYSSGSPINESHNLLEKKTAKRYVLTTLKDGEYEPLSLEELDSFEELYPEISKFWKDLSSLESL